MKMKKLISIASALAITTSAFAAITVTANAAASVTLEHTASAPFDEAVTDGSHEVTIDKETHYFNNEGNNGWVSYAFAEFSFNIPDGEYVESATLTWSGTSGKWYGSALYYLDPDITLDYTSLSTEQNYRYAYDKTLISGEIESLQNGKVDIKTDVTSAVKAMSDNGKIIFQWTGNAGGAELYGKTSEHAPTLTIETTSVLKHKVTIHTAPYAAIKSNDEVIAYSDYKGIATVENLDGTKVTYTVEKGGYNTASSGEITFDEDKSINIDLIPSDNSVLFYEDFNTTGIENQGLLFNSVTVSDANFRLNSNKMEIYSNGNGSRSGSIDFGTLINTDGTYEISFDIDGIYMRNSKSGDFSNIISFVDNNNNIIFSIAPLFTNDKKSVGLKINDTVVTTDDLGDSNLHVKANINNSQITIAVGNYEPVIVNTSAGNVIKGMTYANNKLICARIDNLSIKDVIDIIPATATRTQLYSNTTTTGIESEDNASAWSVTVTPGTNAIQEIGVTIDGTNGDKTIKTSIFGEGDVVFAVVVNKTANEIGTFNVMLDGTAVNASIAATE